MTNEKSVKIYRISGYFKQRRETTPFSKEYLALTQRNAKDKLFSQFGSKNRLKRSQIKIQSIMEITKDEITDPLIEKIIKNDFSIPVED
ncbi:MAG: 50S ribosomal protein L18Ae [Candidatus Hodarchaeales archaeon]|jgi:large subunit ribosomal protein LX